MRSQSPRFSKEGDAEIQGHRLCQAQLMAEESPAQPLGAALNPREITRNVFAGTPWLPPTQPLKIPISSALPGENKTQFGPLRLCWSLNHPMLQPWLCLTPHCWRSGEPLVPSRDPLPCPGPWQREQRDQTRSHGWAGVSLLLPPTSVALFCPLVEGSRGWAHPGSTSQAEGVQCSALPWPRALPSLHLPARPAPMWHRLGPIPSILLDAEFVSTRRVFNPQAPSPLCPTLRPYFSWECGGTKAVAG